MNAESILFTDNAAEKVISLLEDEHNSNLSLRLYIVGGGCSGFQYGFNFDEIINEDDVVIENKGVRLLVDSMSYMYLEGSIVEYETNMMGSRFTVSNPNAATTCGCGSSFSI